MASKIGDGVENLEIDHQWPQSSEEHVWTNWILQRDRQGTTPPTQYRACVHPRCHAYETRVAPSS